MKALRLFISIPLLAIGVLLCIAGFVTNDGIPGFIGFAALVIGTGVIVFTKKKCPYCRKVVDDKATVCGSCGKQIPA